MDGNKKLIGIFLAGLMAITINSCKVQPQGYGGLYVDNLKTDSELSTEKLIENKKDSKLMESLTDSVQLLRYRVAKLQKQLNKSLDSNYIEKKTIKSETTDSLQTGTDFKQIFQEKKDSIAIMRYQISELERSRGIQSDTLYMAKEVVKLINEDSLKTTSKIIPKSQVQKDSIIEKKTQKIESQKLQTEEIDTVLKDSIAVLRYQIAELERSRAMQSDTLFRAEKIEEPINEDSIKTANKIVPKVQKDSIVKKKTEKIAPQKMQVEEKDTVLKDSIAVLRYQIAELEKSLESQSDTLYKSKEFEKLISEDSINTTNKIIPKSQMQKDSIVKQKTQRIEPQKTQVEATDTVFVARQIIKDPLEKNTEIDDLRVQQLKAQDEQIRILQNQVQSLQNANARTQQQAYIPQQTTPQAARVSSQQDKEVELKQIQAQKDTIQLLKQQLRNMQPQQVQNETEIFKKYTQEPRLTNELVREQKDPNVSNNLQDTLQLMKARLLMLEKQSLADKNTIASLNQAERTVTTADRVDTTVIVAYYKRGHIKPLEQTSILNQIKELSKKNVLRATLSGYTDSSGSAAVNSKITTKRLNFLSEMIYPWIPKEKVFFQNFGQTYASEQMVNNERRIEIKILTN